MATTTCKKCNDNGRIQTEVFPGVWGIGLCDCRPAEYWAEQSNKRMAILRERLEEAKKIFGGELGGEVEHAGR